MNKKHALIHLAAACAALASIPATAAVITIPQSALQPTTQLYTQTIGGGIGSPLTMTGGGNAANVGGQRNDDGFSGPINLGFSLNFFGTTYTQFWANNNGNISFGGGISAFTPEGPQGATRPVISPFFADVDTRSSLSGLMNLRTMTDQIIVTWDRVGYYNSAADKLNTFQLVLRGPGYAIPQGEGQIGFFWTTMQWEVGGASGGSGGLCPPGAAIPDGCTPAAIGFGDGASNGQVLEGSTTRNIYAVVQNRSLWFNLSEAGIPEVVPPTPSVPEPGTLALFGIGLAGLAFTRRRLR